MLLSRNHMVFECRQFLSGDRGRESGAKGRKQNFGTYNWPLRSSWWSATTALVVFPSRGHSSASVAGDKAQDGPVSSSVISSCHSSKLTLTSSGSLVFTYPRQEPKTNFLSNSITFLSFSCPAQSMMYQPCHIWGPRSREERGYRDFVRHLRCHKKCPK